MLEQEQTTCANIIDALKLLVDRASSQRSRTFFYFSGHSGQGADRSLQSDRLALNYDEDLGKFVITIQSLK